MSIRVTAQPLLNGDLMSDANVKRLTEAVLKQLNTGRLPVYLGTKKETQLSLLWMRLPTKADLFYLAHVSGLIVGFLLVQSSGETARSWVHPKYRQKGLSSVLYVAAAMKLKHLYTGTRIGKMELLAWFGLSKRYNVRAYVETNGKPDFIHFKWVQKGGYPIPLFSDSFKTMDKDDREFRMTVIK